MGNSHFGVQFDHFQVVRSHSGKSVVLSAFSMLPPLAQLSLASVGESHDELLHAVGLQNDNVTRAVFPVVIQQLQSAKGVELKLASKVYVAQGYQIQEQFEADTRRLFDSEIKNIDFFKSKEAASEINQWVEDKTNHRIKDLVQPDSLNGDTLAVLVNAIYFKGSWKTKFDKRATTDRSFHVSAANTVKIPTMYIDGEFKYGRSDELNAQLLELPYEGDEASFLIVLPNDIEGLPALEEKLKENPALLTEASKHMHSTEVKVFLPKFKIETTTDLKEVLQKIGVTKMFNSRSARLENLLKTEEPLYVSEAIQKAFIEVNEEGAEAAAANVSLERVRKKKARRAYVLFFSDIRQHLTTPNDTGRYPTTPEDTRRHPDDVRRHPTTPPYDTHRHPSTPDDTQHDT
ncbi:Alaserpin [Eumeta japonica]|uniref:Alaserpin n=1 Tax=Eumeta variegata TaxID=151549 RepID=A0A4C1VZL6_EUMVA|nr:Alaserpin [Eumeta japonica]